MLRYKFIISFTFSLLLACSSGNEQKMKHGAANKPKLVVGIVVDQMRAEYLYRFAKYFKEGGFKRLMSEGFQCKNTHYNYIPTYTAPGHASIYTGTVPKYHGIVGNGWYDRYRHVSMYCVEDSTAKTLGSRMNYGKMSAKNMLVSTVSDELKITTNEKSLVYAVSIKDRGAILPGGHMANGVFWYDKSSGHFVSSDYYMPKLPDWLIKFNTQNKADKYLNQTWNLLLDTSKYDMSMADKSFYEWGPKGKGNATFPYHLKELRKSNGNFSLLPSTPFGNSLLTDLALEIIDNTDIGDDDYPDFLSVSYSSTDYIGHAMGPHSMEIQDTYLRLDTELERLLIALDQKVGRGNYTLFLTADHAVADVPQYLIDRKVPGGYFPKNQFDKDLKAYLNQKIGSAKWVEEITNQQVYLNREIINARQKDLKKVQQLVAHFAREYNGVQEAYTATQMLNNEYAAGIAAKLQKGFYYKRSGDVLLTLNSGWTNEMSIATTHGSGFSYDTHVPLIWYGAGIPKGQSYRNIAITDIAPTLSMILNVKLPSACIGTPVVEVLE